MNRCQTTINRLFCNVCEVYLGSKANYALHVLSMEHNENLIKVGKSKSEVNRIIGEETSSDTEVSKAMHVTVERTKLMPVAAEHTKLMPVTAERTKLMPVTTEHTKSTPTSAYGFIGSKLCPSEAMKESDYDKYGHYWQSLAESPFNEQVVSSPEVINTNPTTAPPFGATITKSLISCEVCNVILTKIPDYESHIKSPQHIWNMKLRGTGAAAHIVKGCTDSPTTTAVEVSAKSHQVQSKDLGQLTPTSENLTLIPFPLLYCDACELLLNTPRQFINHVNAGSHKLCVQKKGKMRVKKVQIPVPDKYYCYSCQLVLNSSQQYNEHKNGKKHKHKCTQLITIGITIPPQEQLPEWNLPKISPDKPVNYPEFYERFVLKKEKQELDKSGNLKELLMNENSYENNDCLKTLDTTSLTHISEKAHDLNSFPTHIYRIQNKNLNTYSELPFTLLANYYSSNS